MILITQDYASTLAQYSLSENKQGSHTKETNSSSKPSTTPKCKVPHARIYIYSTLAHKRKKSQIRYKRSFHLSFLIIPYAINVPSPTKTLQQPLSSTLHSRASEPKTSSPRLVFTNGQVDKGGNGATSVAPTPARKKTYPHACGAKKSTSCSKKDERKQGPDFASKNKQSLYERGEESELRPLNYPIRSPTGGEDEIRMESKSSTNKLCIPCPVLFHNDRAFALMRAHGRISSGKS